MSLESLAKIEIDGTEYPLIMTTLATKEMTLKYGSIDKMSKKMVNSKSEADVFETLVYLITLLANQGIMIDNFKHDEKRKLLTEEYVALFTAPADIVLVSKAVSTLNNVGAQREVKSEDIEDAEKNV